MPANMAKPPPACTGCGSSLQLDPRGFNSCTTTGCGGNLYERFPIAPVPNVPSKGQRKRRRRRSKKG